MTLLDGSNSHAVIAFADDPSLQMFNERLDAYMGPIPDGQKYPPFVAFFDAISGLRAYGPRDRVSEECREHVDSLSEAEVLRLDVQCWHPDDSTIAAEWLRDLRSAVDGAEGKVVSTYQNDAAGVLVARIYLSSDRLDELAEVDVIASIDLLPHPDLSAGEIFGIDEEQLPDIAAPADEAPILGLVDSGVASAHPLLAGSILASEALSQHLDDGEDRIGHGTMVASLALFGPLATALRLPRMVPIARVVSVRVLDGDGFFPDQSLWESDMVAAIEYCVSQGARVINLSLGDATKPFRPPRQLPAAALIDQLARTHNVVIVTSAGNSDPSEYLQPSDDPGLTYVVDLLEHDRTGLLAPGTAALALTVGGVAGADAAGAHTGREPAERKPYGGRHWPSTVTRRGFGVGDAIKPELVAVSGTHEYEPGRQVVRDAELAVVGAHVGVPGRLLGVDLGTSLAAPLVSRIALAVLARFPDFSANLVRALVLLGARQEWDPPELEAESRAHRADVVRRLIGYGEPSIAGSLEVNDHRAVLVGEGAIPMDGVHIYDVPIPRSFLESGGKRYVDIALAFDPPARGQRLDYLGNKIEFYLVRGMGVDELVETFAHLDPEESAEPGSGEAETELDDASESDAVDEGRPPAISSLGRRIVKLDTSAQFRSRSANQLGRWTISQRLSASDDLPMHIVVRSVNRWCDATASQDYALAVSLARDVERGEIYAELANRLESVIEVELEAEAEAELGG